MAEEQCESGRDKQDPIMAGHRKMVFQKDLPIALRYVDFQQNVVNLSSSQKLHFKIVQQGPSQNPSQVILQLTTNNDLYFYYTHSCSQLSLFTKQNFCSQLRNYAGSMIKVLNKLQHDKKFSCTVTIMSDSKATLNVMMSSEYKTVLIMSLELSGESEENYQQQSISYRYMTVRQQADNMNTRLKQIHLLIQEKNPSLLLQLHKKMMH